MDEQSSEPIADAASDPPASKPSIGVLGWQDLTVADAPGIRDFYQQVIGWTSAPEPMPDDVEPYEDYHMISPATGESVTGICHARGTNANVPPQWLLYWTVANVAESANRCVELGGEILDGPRKMGYGDFCVIRDPAGAVCALYAPPE